ncbi:PepSY domain-containing protein [Hydrogenophaga sp.]|uniref:PepSY domain-containing protein n=1 Tax=Hydrogenophaga sp. TaxID=1904254 RepID=UPI002FC5B4E0
MKSLVLSALLLAVAGTAMASPTCTAPKDKWQPEATFRKDLEAQGYQIKTFKVSKGQCYEIYGTDKAGKKVEIYFDPVSGKPVEQK